MNGTLRNVTRGTITLALVSIFHFTGAHGEMEAGEDGLLALGRHTFKVSQETSEGVPVIPMWNAGIPTNEVGAGFPILTDAEHFWVWQPRNKREWAFNHFAALTWHRNRLYAMWGNHPIGELGPGQRVLFSWSDDLGETWSAPTDLFPRPGRVAAPGEHPDIHTTPDRWVTIGDRLFAVAYTVGGRRVYPMAWEVEDGKRVGIPFLLRELPDGAQLPDYMRQIPNAEEVPPIAEWIWAWYEQNEIVSWWGTLLPEEGLPRRAVDNASMIEPYTYRASSGDRVLLMRSMPFTSSDPENNYRLYVSFKDNGDKWSVPHPTNIPDSPSRFEVLRHNGYFLLLGNQIAPEFDTWQRYLPRDPLTIAISQCGYDFKEAYALRVGAPKEYRFSGLQRRSLGFGYPSSVIANGWLFTLYSVGKEDMAFTRVRLSDFLEGK